MPKPERLEGPSDKELDEQRRAAMTETLFWTMLGERDALDAMPDLKVSYLRRANEACNRALRLDRELERRIGGGGG